MYAARAVWFGDRCIDRNVDESAIQWGQFAYVYTCNCEKHLKVLNIFRSFIFYFFIFKFECLKGMKLLVFLF